MKNGITAVLIVKNEERVLQRCLDSLVHLDEVVVLDTGSSDKTMEIARSAGAKVFEWAPDKPFHFANARNEALKHATNDWVVTLDADEVLERSSFKHLKKAVKNREIDAFVGTHLNHPVGDTKTVMPTRRMLLFRKDRWEWRYRVHERLVAKPGPPTRLADLKGLMIRHLPEGGDKRQGRRGQNLELLRLCTQENPEYRYAFLQLGIELSFREEWSDAIRPLEQYAQGPCEGHLGQGAARMLLARALARAGGLQRAMNEFVQARKDAPGRREPLYWAAVELIRVGLIPDAVWWLEEALKLPKLATPAFSLYSVQLQGNLIEDTLAECRQKMKEAEVR